MSEVRIEVYNIDDRDDEIVHMIDLQLIIRALERSSTDPKAAALFLYELFGMLDDPDESETITVIEEDY